MTKTKTFGFACLAILLLALIVAGPVSAVTIGSSSAASTPAVSAPAQGKSLINATISSSSPAIGDQVTISGFETGANTSTGVQLWVFAGNYVNVSTIPAKTDGSFSKTFDSTGYPPATYYVFLQSPGPDGIFNIDFVDSGIYSGEVINTLTKAPIFNFTGAGSVQDATAAQALSNAINSQGNDDSYTKLTFQLVAPSPSTTVPVATTVAQTASSTAPTRSSLPVEIPGIALAFAATGFLVFSRKK